MHGSLRSEFIVKRPKLFAIATNEGWVRWLTCGGDDYSTWPGAPCLTTQAVLEPHEVLTRTTMEAARRVLPQLGGLSSFNAVIVELQEVEEVTND